MQLQFPYSTKSCYQQKNSNSMIDLGQKVKMRSELVFQQCLFSSNVDRNKQQQIKQQLVYNKSLQLHFIGVLDIQSFQNQLGEIFCMCIALFRLFQPPCDYIAFLIFSVIILQPSNY
ncbi:Hypothetical_protein [Hexamita inflata]|uniref:Hypothetical_protein n=1 Tax=Hexamita inflata TaxID=28002 RepID=A0AA86QCJ2_9EUKA|nr:Hypothetical protein HINF_LOCUS43123 [Hexamita inflata]